MTSLPPFDTPRLAEAVELLTPEQLDLLPFGVTGLDSQNLVRVFNKAEAEHSGFGDRAAAGRLFFVDVAPCMNNGYFKGRIDKARREGTLDITFNFVGDFSDCERELTVRAQSGKDGGFWIFIRARLILAVFGGPMVAKRILLVDDEALVALAAEDALMAAGYAVVGPAGRARQRVAACRKRRDRRRRARRQSGRRLCLAGRASAGRAKNSLRSADRFRQGA